MNELLEEVEHGDPNDDPEDHQGPHYELNWGFTDKDTIRVVFNLFSIPRLLIESNKNSLINKHKLNLLATMSTMPSRTFKSITVLRYFRFIIRPYHKNREIILKWEELVLRNSSSRKYSYFTNTLTLTSLNHHEKYSVCICYYQRNSSKAVPDLLLCQDVINDHSKFSELRTSAKHGLVFIGTQYSIIAVLLVVLQTVYTMRRRRVAHLIAQILSNKAHSIRSTLSSVSLVRQSFSSLDTAAEQQHATNDHANRHVPTIEEEKGLKKRIISSPAIVITEQPPMSSTEATDAAATSDESEPFLKRIPSKNHVHFLLGPGEVSDEEEENEVEDTHASASSRRGPYDDQADAELSMAHILDTNKPWSRHSHQTSPV